MKLRPQLPGPAPDAPARFASRLTPHASRRAAGVALIITLIMISVITFMAITFLAVSRREKGQVTTTLEQTTARLAADSAHERALAEMLATMLATTNALNFDLLVSTNYVNRSGFDPGAQPVVSPNLTNVNYDYTAVGASLTPAQALQNLANLLVNPRPPVFITNRFYAKSNEFRFYVDLNRDGTYTPSGWLIVTNGTGGFYNTNGTEINPPFSIPPYQTPPPNVLRRYFTGDPEFIGVLERAEFPHSPSNKFVARYAFIILPAGKTLDVNYIHNYARFFNAQLRANTGDGFRRNQGASAAEINLASFLVDLNTNAWPGPNQNSTLLGSPYQYAPDGLRNTGAAFDDALSLLRYRYATNYNFLQVAGVNAGSGLDRIDAYCLSPLMSNVFGLTLDRDAAFAATRPWLGSDNPNHFFTSQDFFDLGKLPPSFVNRLTAATTVSPSSYNRYTYFNLLAQLGTDSAPEPASKLNLNYANIGGLSATNFVSWTNTLYGRRGSEVFFTNAVDRLLRRYSADWLARDRTNFIATFGSTNFVYTTNFFGAGNIPVFVNGRFAYTPAVHRLLQLAANMFDAINPSYFPGTTNPVPTVFRPRFVRTGNNIFIQDFVEVLSANSLIGLPLRDLTSSTNVVAAVQPNDLIFGVPLVVGARKGLPNFNEFSTESVVQITRKVELRKSAPGGGNLINQTNQMFTIGISNVFGAEFWNSYTNNYPRPVDILVTNLITLSLTNDYNYKFSSNLIASGSVTTNSWPRWSGKQADASFIVPLRSNHIILPVSVYRQGLNQFVPLTQTFEPNSGFAFPRWGLAITNRVQAIIVDRATRRIVDYVQLSSMATFRDLAGEMAKPRTALYFAGLWATNALKPGSPLLSDQPGIIQQIEISKGNDGQSGSGDWRSYGFNQLAGATKAQEIANFQAFFTPNHLSPPYYDQQSGTTFYGTNYATSATAPFSPTFKQSLPFVWQANDPLVHYTTGDMEDLDKSGILQLWTPPGSTNMPTIANVGRLNDRYRPWGGNPYETSRITDKKPFNTVLKDPGMWSSELWQFPTNKLPTLGWLGRVHRGTPWQTIYLKSTTVADALNAKSPTLKAGDWQKWAGNPNAYDVANNQPETDRGIFDLFTTAFNDNAARGQLPINQSGLAAWSAVFGGMVALTNTTADADLYDGTRFDPAIIEPAGIYDPANPNTLPAVAKIVDGKDGINRTRTNLTLFPLKTFSRLGDILAVPALTAASPFLNQTTALQQQRGMNDAVYEWLPQQMLSLVRLGEPRFVVYAYGQALKPANHSIQVSGPYFGLCTNYQITAEVVTRAVVKVVGSPDPRQTGNLDPNLNYPPRIVVESFNVLPPD